MRMTRSFVTLAIAAGAALIAAAPITTADAAAPCVVIRAEVRYGAAGYNHVVVLMNACEHAEACTVTTDVNPEPIKATVPPRSSTEVVTFLGSPARVFVPKAICVPVR